jgi:hypothetical protein
MRFLCIVWLIAIHLCACAVAAERGVDSFDVELPFGVEIGPDGRKSKRIASFDSISKREP